MKNNHSKLYNKAEYYRLAFSYRDIARECVFLEQIYYKHLKEKMTSCIEIASGPAEHAFYFANKNVNTAVIDISEDMIDYVQHKDANKRINTYLKDMSNFKILEKFDISFMMLDSFAYLLTDEDINSHFHCVADVLKEDGIYIIEMDHPGSYLGNGHYNNCGKDDDVGLSWTINNEKNNIKMHWGAEGSTFDSATQIANINTLMNVYDKLNNKFTIIKDSAKQRIFTANEFNLHVKLSSRFKILNQFRLFDIDKPFNNDGDGERMISVLQKIR